MGYSIGTYELCTLRTCFYFLIHYKGTRQGLRIATTQSPPGAFYCFVSLNVVSLCDMRSTYPITLLIVLVGAGTYWYQSTASVCPVPLSYRVGDIDPAFGLSREQALQYAVGAEAVWEQGVERELFVYDEAAPLTIRFIYDDRQESANFEAIQRAILDEQRKQSEAANNALEQLRGEYDQLIAAYTERTAEYEEKLKHYNEEVTSYNDRGGAPEEEFERLQKEQTALTEEADGLDELSEKLSLLAKDINVLAERGNQLVDSYNEGVMKYNKQFGFAYEFTQGDYQGESINVYTFSSEEEVIAVLAHEFGHALGLGHVEGTSSLMYYLLESSDEIPMLTTFDRQSYEATCGYTESFPQKIHRIIRKILEVIT